MVTCFGYRYLILGTHQLPLKSFEGALRYLGETDIDIDETQCIGANLIDKVSYPGEVLLVVMVTYTHTHLQGYIRGYISHQHQKLVVSKQNPFPLLSAVLL